MDDLLKTASDGVEFSKLPDTDILYQYWNRHVWGNERYLRGTPMFSLEASVQFQPNQYGHHVGEYPHYPTDEQFAEQIRMFYHQTYNQHFVSCCTHCCRVFYNSSFLFQHQKTYEHICKEAKDQNLPPPDKPLECTPCGRFGKLRFKTTGAKTNHLASIAHKKQIGIDVSVHCVYCDYELANRYKYNRHCKKATPNGKVTRHQKNIDEMHTKNSFQCNLCAFWTGCPLKWTRHLETKSHKITHRLSF